MLQKLFFLIAFLIILPQIIQAEAVFLTTGEIIDASVLKEARDIIELKLSDGTRKSFKRSDIIRINYNDEYKNRVYIYFFDDSYAEAFIVSEDKDTYIYRQNLNINAETNVKKALVKLVAKEKLTEINLGLKISAGAGAIGSLALFYQIGRLEFSLGPGIIYIEESQEKRYAMPVKAQAAYTLVTLDLLALYGFGNATYAVGLENYESQFGLGAGGGLRLWEQLFFEGSYQSVFKKSGFSLGLGLNVNF